MHRMELSVYQCSVHGLYRPRHNGLVGYVATTLVIVGVSISRSAASSSDFDSVVAIGLLIVPQASHAAASRSVVRARAWRLVAAAEVARGRSSPDRPPP